MTSPAGTMRPSLDRAPARFVQPVTDLLGPITHAPVTPATPIWSAVCEEVPAVCGCRHCGSLLEAPCQTSGGKVAHDHAGRVPKCSVTGLRQCPWHIGGNHPEVAS